MKGLAAVVRLELERSWLLLPLAIAVGLVPFAVAPFVDAPWRNVSGLAYPLAVLFGAGTAVLLGATTIAGDLGAGRLGFYFSRPLPWWAIWAGKLVTAVALTLAVSLLVLAPGALLHEGGDRFPGTWLTRIGLILLVIGAAHWGAIALRSRSAWIALDLAALPLAVWGVNTGMRSAFEQGFFPTGATLRLFVAALVFAAIAAGAVQVAVGRTSAIRSHAAASLTGWALVGSLVLALQVVTRTAFHPGPQGLDSAHVMALGPRGDTALFTGVEHVMGFRSSFSHRFVASPRGLLRVEPHPWTSYGFAFSGDGTSAVWLGRGEEFTHLRILRHDLASDEVTSADIEVQPPTHSEWPRRVLADETGSRVALLRAGSASVFDAVTGTRLADLDHEGGPVEYLAFREGRGDLVVRSTPGGGLLLEALQGGETTPIGTLDPPITATDGWRNLHVDAPGDRLLAGARGEARLVDTGTGATLASFTGDPAPIFEGLLLSDGGALIAAADPTGTALQHYDAAGSLLGELDLGPAHSVYLLEVAAGRVVAALANPGQARSTPGGPADLGDRLAVVETSPLRVLRVDDGLTLRPPQGPFLPATRDRPAGDALLVTRILGLEPNVRSSLLSLDVATGETEWVAGAR